MAGPRRSFSRIGHRFRPLPPERLMRPALPLLAFTLLVVGGCSRRAGREPGLTGGWIVTRSELADSGVLVPSNLTMVAEYGLVPPPGIVPAKDSVVVFPRRVTEIFAVELGSDGAFRDPSAQVVGNGRYAIESDSVRVTGIHDTLAFAFKRFPQREYKLAGGGLVIRSDETLTWSDKRDRVRLVMMRVAQNRR